MVADYVPDRSLPVLEQIRDVADVIADMPSYSDAATEVAAKASVIRSGEEVLETVGTFLQEVWMTSYSSTSYIANMSISVLVMDCIFYLLDISNVKANSAYFTLDDYPLGGPYAVGYFGVTKSGDCELGSVSLSFYDTYGSYPYVYLPDCGISFCYLSGFYFSSDFYIDLSNNQIPVGEDTDADGSYGTVCDIINCLYNTAYILNGLTACYLNLLGNGAIEVPSGTSSNAETLGVAGWTILYEYFES